MPRDNKNIQEYSIRIGSDPKSLENARDFVIQLLKESGFSNDEISILELVTYEACANSIEHAYSNQPDFYVDLNIQIRGRKVFIKIEDSGQEFQPGDIHPLDIGDRIDRRASRGMGLPLMKALMDEVTIERTFDNHNRITMRKDFSKKKKAPKGKS